MDISIMPLYCYIIYLLRCFASFSPVHEPSLFLTHTLSLFFLLIPLFLYFMFFCANRFVFFSTVFKVNSDLFFSFIFFFHVSVVYPFKVKSYNFLPFFSVYNACLSVIANLSFFFLYAHAFIVLPICAPLASQYVQCNVQPCALGNLHGNCSAQHGTCMTKPTRVLGDKKKHAELVCQQMFTFVQYTTSAGAHTLTVYANGAYGSKESKFFFVRFYSTNVKYHNNEFFEFFFYFQLSFMN